MRATRWIGVTTIACAMATASCGGETESQPPPEHPPVVQSEEDTGNSGQAEGGEQATGKEPETETAEPATDGGTQTAESEPQKQEEQEPAVEVVAAERSPIEGEPPTMEVLTPEQDQTVWKKARVRVRFENWELEEAPGKHMHLIVDNHPYIAIRDIGVRNPVELMSLFEETYGWPLEEGTHLLRAFPSRANHESVKEGKPFAAIIFHNKKEGDLDLDPEAPLLTYSRPKGCYPAGERILLDFYISNIDGLGKDGYKVEYTIDDEITGEITEWKPHYIENLSKGDHEIRLQLLDENGEFVEGPYNDTTRDITVKDDCSGGDGADSSEQ